VACSVFATGIVLWLRLKSKHSRIMGILPMIASTEV
jgi:hypothetical protein